ncbi:hypothetical protein HDE_06725 [Halotydeus destructor]|nr:hypothetical protein HDE_06725 [Halotydeus destructor]
MTNTKEKKRELTELLKELPDSPRRIIKTALQQIEEKMKETEVTMKKLQKERDSAVKELEAVNKRKLAVEEVNQKQTESINGLKKTVDDLKQRLAIYQNAHKQATGRKKSSSKETTD